MSALCSCFAVKAHKVPCFSMVKLFAKLTVEILLILLWDLAVKCGQRAETIVCDRSSSKSKSRDGVLQSWGRELVGARRGGKRRSRATPIAELVDNTHIGHCRGSNPVRWIVSPASYPSTTRAARVGGPGHPFCSCHRPSPTGSDPRPVVTWLRRPISEPGIWRRGHVLTPTARGWAGRVEGRDRSGRGRPRDTC